MLNNRVIQRRLRTATKRHRKFKTADKALLTALMNSTMVLELLTTDDSDLKEMLTPTTVSYTMEENNMLLNKYLTEDKG